MRKRINSPVKYVFLTIILMILTICCDNSKEGNQGLITINAEKAYNKPPRDLMLSELIKDVEYIKLETRPDCLVARGASAFISENYLVVLDPTIPRVFLFTREGKYLYDIGSRGKGPGEYNFVNPRSLIISPDEKYIILKLNWTRGIFNLYGIDGSFIKKVIMPVGKQDGYGYFGTDNFVSYKKSSDPQTENNQLLIYDKEINLRDSLIFPFRYNAWIPGKGFSVHDFSIYQGNIYFQQILNDTIFRIDQEYSIIPHLVVDYSGLKIPSPFVPKSEREFDYYQPFTFNIIDNYDFIRFRSNVVGGISRLLDKFMVYNRIDGDVFFLDTQVDPYIGDNKHRMSIINDLDGVKNPDILFRLINDMSTDYLDIIDAKTYIESGAVNPRKLATDKYYIKLNKLLAESDIEDNPIIRIFHLK